MPREELRIKATHDPLTGLLNRSAFFDGLERISAAAVRRHWPIALLMVNIDHFKSINDRHGHLAGDAVLREVAVRLHRCLRAADLIGRYGGEEFVIVAPDCDPSVAVDLAERLRATIGAPIAIPAGPLCATIAWVLQS